MESIVALILGWFLGCFSPWIADLIQRPYRRNKFRKSIYVELTDLRMKLASVVYLAYNNSGRFDRSTIEWVEAIFRSDKSPFDKMNTDETLRKYLEFSDAELKEVASAKPHWEMFKWKKLNASFLASQVGLLHLFSPEFQRLAHEILGGIAVYNEEIDTLRMYHQKSFESVSDTNRKLLLFNFQLGSEHLGIIARNVANLIGEIRLLKK